ncbi:kelch repeat-containing protein [Paucibacter sp. APW11]|uniref:Kelch repeat-containing protein n=1 Tax=Roseateles aquae TaxID=3077235 RepID=A0ABU3P7W4_9BURK|nr:kelch repeat-containing protein [Paucibacter sp. APW11]MDT8998649.1 kelch repeat-containing protein [Paucibacter sp. APW11]
MKPRRLRGLQALWAGLALSCSQAQASTVEANPLRWETLAPMPIGVQEIYPVVHGSRLIVAGGLSSELPAEQGHLSNALQIYDPSSGRWSLGPALPEGRHHAQLLSLGKSLYLIGGFVRCDSGDWCASREVLRLDDGSARWQRLGALPQALTESTAFVKQGQIHLVSGRSPRGEANAQWGDHRDVAWHWVYEAQRDRWHALADGPEIKSSAAALAAGEQAWLIGGRQYNGANLRSVHRFDAVTGRWQAEAPLAFAQAAHGVGLLGRPGQELICSIGGETADNGGGMLSQVQCRALGGDRWQVIGEMPEPRHGLGVLSLNGQLYAIGGARQPGLTQTSPRLDRLSLQARPENAEAVPQ